ncbi:HIT domain-containing protein [Psychrosphaera haliotis]|uniref:HIT domain-containing protein n=1 Tax=Psychrosphaera haliotis TaxID=555083 RepID=A0A6N8FAD4_9GAMM|nr:HIT family protein [Psychrosphaera haliotis]MUH73575.1 HIT domain-containing protein [Psychrosphaera haliotis]
MFILDHRIERDSILIAELPLSQLRLQNDQRYPWLVLVPKVEGAKEVHELKVDEAQQLLKESNVVANALAIVTGCKKVNVANLGNVVEQLHWHVVARFENDLTWPGPIWGIGEAECWEQKKRLTFVESLLKEIQSNQEIKVFPA